MMKTITIGAFAALLILGGCREQGSGDQTGGETSTPTEQGSAPATDN